MAWAFFAPFEGSSETPVGRCAKALFLGTLTGAGLTTVPAMLLPPMILFVFPVALFCWLLGMFLIGAPLWALLHLAGFRRRRVAILLGAVTAPAALWTYMWLTSGRPAPQEMDLFIGGAGLLLAIVGAVAANVVWRIAYRGFAPGNGDSRPAAPEDSHRRLIR